MRAHLARLFGLWLFAVAAAANAAIVTPPAPSEAAGRSAINLDPVVSTLDHAANGGVAVYGDAFTWDQRACYSTGNVAFCQTSANITGSASPLSVDVLPLYIAAGSVPVTGTNIPANSVVASYTGTPGGPGTITLNNAPTGAVSTGKFGTPASVLTFQNSGSLTTTVGMTQGGITVTLGTTWCKPEYAGMPITIPGAGPNGNPLYTHIVSCGTATNPNAVFGVEDAAATTISASATITFGANFQQTCGARYETSGITGCVGSGALVGSWLSGGGSGPGAQPVTVAAVYAPNIIQLDTAGTQVINGVAMHFVFGHDDSTAINNACAYARAAHIRILSVPVNHYVPNLSRICYASLLLRGQGRLIVNDETRASLWTGHFPPYPDPVVVPWSAPAPTPPRRAVVAASHLKLFRTTLTPQIISNYDSLSNIEANQVSDMGSYPWALMTAVRQQNPGLGVNMQNPGTSGGTMAAVMDGIAGVTNLPCVTNTVSSWFSQVAANCPGQLFTVGGGTNDDNGFNPSTIVNTWLKMNIYGGFFTVPRDIVYYTNHPRTRMVQGNVSGAPVEDGAEAGAGMLCSFAKVEGYPCIDAFAEGQKHVWGFDPHGYAMRRAYDMAYGANAISLPLAYDRFVHGFNLKFTSAGVRGSTFWSSLTGNGGATDPRGPMLAFRTTNNTAAIGGGGYVTVRLFYLTGPGTVVFECDMGDLMPGMACQDPATGTPPVTPASIAGTVTVANNGTAGHATVVMSGGATFVGCVVGATVTVPTSDATVTVPGLNPNSYVAPTIGTVSTCDSATQITLTAAVTTPVVFTGQVFWGSPIVSSQNLVDNVGDSSGNELIQFAVTGDDLELRISNTPAGLLYSGKIWRPRARFPILIYSGGNRPGLTIAGSSSSGATTFATAQPVPNLTDFTDDDVVGPGSVTPVSNTTYMSPESGDGYAHNTERFGRQVLMPLFAAQDFALGNGGISVNVNSGAAYTVPNCLVGKVLVNDTTAPTITLPSNCSNSIEIVDIGGQAAAHVITIAAPSGTTLNGSSTITTNFGRRLITYAGLVAISQ